MKLLRLNAQLGRKEFCMKKIFAILLTLSMVFALASCSGLAELELPPLPDVNEKLPEEQTVSAAEEQPELTPEPVQAPEQALAEHVIVNVSSSSETFMDPQNGTEPILIFSYETPVVYVESKDDVSEKINEHIAHINETYLTGNDYGYGTASGMNLLLEMATDNYSYIVNSGEEGIAMLYSSSRSVKTERADEQVLSLVFNTNEYTGGAHGNYIDRAYVFDTVSGERVTFDMLSSDSEALKNFLHEFMLKLYAEDKDQYFSQRVVEDLLYEISLEEAFANLLREGSWYLGQDGIVIFSDIYELGPYAAGITEFTVPYSELEGILDEKWLPTEKSGEGSFVIKRQEDISDGSVQVIDRVVADEEGDSICLVAEGVVYDVRLSQVTYADRFYETAQLWACSYMKDCLLQLELLIPEGMPAHMLSYTDGEGVRHSLLITVNGADGELMLAEDDIHAVG